MGDTGVSIPIWSVILRLNRQTNIGAKLVDK